ncbi:MAG: alkaline phosphatase family protein [Actinobacteria bacterium]|nr:alkaline phosphatase family protein [Actinomycetota bacterium]
MLRARMLASAIIVTVSSSLLFFAPGAHSTTPFDKINHMIVVMQENRSFDNYLGQLAAYDPSLGVEAEPNTGNLDPNGNLITPFHQSSYCEVVDLDHSWNGTHNEWNNGAMDGFAKANAKDVDPTGSRAMGYYDQTDLPFYYSLYDTFAMSDTYFSSVLDQTFPNRFYLLAGTSFGHVANDFPVPPGNTDPVHDYAQTTVFNRLDDNNVSWKVYFEEVPFSFLFGYNRTHAAGHVFPISQYFADAASGNLPQVSFIDPVFIATVNVENDEHPPANVQMGQLATSKVINALFESPNWSDSALFLTYDEHGGYYDHLPPPSAIKPDSIAPRIKATDYQAEFDNLGIRVPFTVVSPYSKSHYVSSALPQASAIYDHPDKVYSHTSILRTIEERFGLGTLTARDAASNDLADLFDFSASTFATPPTLAPAVVDPAKVAECETREHVPTDL